MTLPPNTQHDTGLLTRLESRPYTFTANPQLLQLFTTTVAPLTGAFSSAGVFNADGNLIRTIWAGSINDPRAANPIATRSAWDNTLEDGSVAPSGNYTIRVLSHNSVYTWEGSIGNTTPVADHVGRVDYHAYGSVINGMCVTATEIYFCYGYDERIQTVRFMQLPDIQHSATVFPPQAFRSAFGSPSCICTDGVNTYFGCNSSGQSDVFGVVNATKTGTPFPSGNVGTFPGHDSLSHRTDAAFNGNIVGVAVQQSGNFIFITRIFLNTIYTCHKTTGANVTTFGGITGPGYIASNPATPTQLWVASSSNTGTTYTTITKCAVDGSGNITTTGTTITVSDCRGLAVSPDGATLLVVDADSVQQVKAYNTSNGSVKSAFGTSGAFGDSGGYANGPAVSNTRFMFFAFQDLGVQGPLAFICFAPDGSWWLGDLGNERYLHFSSGNSPTLIEQFGYIPSFYSCRACRGDPTRVFANHLEYQIDYTKTLGPGNGSWTLAKNWMQNLIANFPAALKVSGQYTSLKFVGVYSNGRTYATTVFAPAAFSTTNATSWRQIWELTATGLRDTHVIFWPTQFMDANMDMFSGPSAGHGDIATVYKNSLTGFDGSANPTYQFFTIDNSGDFGGIFAGYIMVYDYTGGQGGPGPPAPAPYPPTAIVFTSQALPAQFPFTFNYDNNSENVVQLTKSGIWPVIDPALGDTDPILGITVFNNHFGGFNWATGKVVFNTAPIDSINSGGKHHADLLYPPAPFEGVEGGTNLGPLMFLPGDQHLFNVTNADGWGNNQANVWTHFHESGLALARFGPAAPYFGAGSLVQPGLYPSGNVIPGADPYSFRGLYGMCGNVGRCGIALVSGSYYLYEHDEWYHGGVTRWRIDNTGSLISSSFPVIWNSANYSPAVDPTDMIAGLPYAVALANGTTPWTRTDPESDDPSFRFHVWTSTVKPDRLHPDLELEAAFIPDTNLHGVFRSLPAVTGNWTISGTVIMFPGTAFSSNPFEGGNIYFDVLDGSGNIILRWFSWVHGDLSAAGTITINGTDHVTPGINLFPPPAQSNLYTQAFVGALRPFSIAANVGAGTLTFTYDIHTLSGIPVFQVGANIAGPATIRMAYIGTTGPGGGQPLMAVSDLHFPTGPAPPPALPQYRLLGPHVLNLDYVVETNSIVSEGDGNVPFGWVPTLAVDPLNAAAVTAFYNAGPRGNVYEDLMNCWRPNFIDPARPGVTHWVHGPAGWTLTGLGAGFPPVPS